MMRHSLLDVLLLGVITLTSCMERSELYCKKHPDDPVYCQTQVDAPTSCSSNAECATPTAVCDLGVMACVECTPADANACVGASPVCGDDRACRGCEAHDECASNACLPDGSCADTGTVAYVSPTGSDNASCTLAMPCTDVADALATNRAYVKISGTNDEGSTVDINNQDVTILADPGAKLVRTSNGVVLEIRGTSQVTIYDLEISGGSGAGGIGISLPTGNTASLTVVRGRIMMNTGGGISISGGRFDITNTFIVQNGGPTSTIGGVTFSNISGAGPHRFEFNTVAANGGGATVHTGISCGTVLVPLVFSNNIVYGNTVSGGGKQFGGSTNCSTTYSDIGPDATPGAGNINEDPQFMSLQQGNFHLASTSPAKDAADPSSMLPDDVDGDARPQGAARDMGADEVTP